MLHKIRLHMNRNIILLVVIAVILVGLSIVERSQIIDVPEPIVHGIEKAFFILVVLLIAAVMVRLTHQHAMSLFDESVEVEHKILMAKLYILAIYTVSMVVILWQLGVTLQSIFIVLGLVTTGFAFALREVILSYLIWFILLTKKPFRIGDYITIGDDQGVVEHIGTFYVFLDDSPETGEDYIRVPNKTFIEKPIHNLGRNKIKFSVVAPLKKIPSFSRLKEVEELMIKDTGNDVLLTIDTDGDKWHLRIDYYTKLEDRHKMHDLVLKRFLHNFK